MANDSNSSQFAQFSETELKTMDQKVDLELHEVQCKMLTMGGIMNTLAAAFAVWILQSHAKTLVLISWIVAVILANGINILFAAYYRSRHIPATQLKPWRNSYRFILAILSLVWGCMGILYVGSDLNYQIYTTVFLLIGLVGFGFGSVTDFKASLISLSCLMLPYISYHLYFGLHALLTIGSDADLNLAFTVSLLSIAIFLLIATYVGYRLTKKFFKLTFINVELSKRLENLNKMLEQRVEERTSELNTSLERATYLATHDALTSLPNIRLLSEQMKVAMKEADKNQRMLAVMFFSLNKMENINDALGHRAGELVVKTIADRLKIAAKGQLSAQLPHILCTVYLSRSDEFILLFQSVEHLSELETISNILFSTLNEPIRTKSQTIKLTASIGVSVYPNDAKDRQLLLMNADAAKLRGKEVGGNSFNVYRPEINADIVKHLEMESDLHAAVQNNEFILHYQPFIDLKTGEVCGMEALVRWQHPAFGFISPEIFIHLAESNGMIAPLGLWVLRTACMQTKRWHEQGFTKLKVAVNLSAKQLQQSNIIEAVAEILKETNLDTKYLELELTETEVFKDEAVPMLQKFEAMGISLSIDDFGTGFSSLTNLKRLNISKLKIDKTFVQDIEVNDGNRAIVSHTIALAKKLKITVLAEGVETNEQRKILREDGCDLAQGYYFSRPVDADKFTALLQNDAQEWVKKED